MNTMKKLTAIAIIGFIALGTVGSVFAVGIINLRIQQVIIARQIRNQTNVPLYCEPGRHLAGHTCWTECPVGYHGVLTGVPGVTISVCMNSARDPTSIYDLSGLLVSADNGATVYAVVPNVPLEKHLYTRNDYSNFQAWLSVSSSILDPIFTGLDYDIWSRTYPRVTTEIASIGDMVADTFLISRINLASVDGIFSTAGMYGSRPAAKTIMVGDEIGDPCNWWESEKPVSIDYTDQIVVFNKTFTIEYRGSCLE